MCGERKDSMVLNNLCLRECRKYCESKEKTRQRYFHPAAVIATTSAMASYETTQWTWQEREVCAYTRSMFTGILRMVLFLSPDRETRTARKNLKRWRTNSAWGFLQSSLAAQTQAWRTVSKGGMPSLPVNAPGPQELLPSGTFCLFFIYIMPWSH